jgi:hypothetical protein
MRSEFEVRYDETGSNRIRLRTETHTPISTTKKRGRHATLCHSNIHDKRLELFGWFGYLTLFHVIVQQQGVKVTVRGIFLPDPSQLFVEEWLE